YVDADGKTQTLTVDAAGNVTVPAGVTDLSVTVPTIQDDVYEGQETFDLVAADQNGVTTNGSAQAGATVTDTSPIYAVVSVDQASVSEGGVLRYTVKLVDGAGNEVKVPAGNSVEVKLDWSGAAANNADTLGRPDSITVIGGNSQVSFEVPTVDDVYKESDESITVTIKDVVDTNGSFNSVTVGSDKSANTVVKDDFDVTTVSIKATVTKTSEITVENVRSSTDFKVTATGANGKPANISTIKGTDHDGFGVSGAASGDNAELGFDQSSKKSEKLTVEFNKEVKTFEVQFAWRANTEKAKVEFFGADGKSVGWAIITEGKNETEAILTYYDAKGKVMRTEKVPGGSDKVDLAYTFEPGSGLNFTKAEFTAVGTDDDYLVHSIKYKEVTEDASTLPGTKTEVRFDIQTSNPPDPSKYDFKTSFPTAKVEIDGKVHDVQLDREGKGFVTVETDGSKDLVANVLEVNGNFESVDVPVNLTLNHGKVIEDGNSGGKLIGGQGDDLLIGDHGGTVTSVEPGKNYNIALVVDTSGSMKNPSGSYWKTSGKDWVNGEWKSVKKGAVMSREMLMKEALIKLVTDLAEHDGQVNISLVDFHTNAKLEFKLNNLNTGNVQSLISAINKLTAEGGTNYDDAFRKAVDWFNTQNNSGFTTGKNYENLTFFLTDGNPTFNNKNTSSTGASTEYEDLNEAINSFEALSNKGKVYGIGIGSGVSENYLKFFDNTDKQGVQTVWTQDYKGNWKTVSGMAGQPQIVMTAEELAAALQGAKDITELAAVGDDVIDATAGGNNIIFGDAIDTSKLDWAGLGVNLKDVPSGGLDSLKYFIARSEGLDSIKDIDNAKIYDFLLANHGKFNVLDTTQGGSDLISSGSGNDILFAGAGNDHLYAGAGDDILYAQSGTNVLVGGQGNDKLFSGTGNDTFAWLANDEGTVDLPARDTVYNFGMGAGSKFGEDKIDLADMLKGSGINSGNLDEYLQLNFDSSSNKTVLSINTKGQLGSQGDNANQIIEFDGVNLVGDGQASQSDLIKNLIQQGKLNIDQ
ncbi:hypothetical protein C660_13854, partial [Alcaligenes sp. HPC1271]